MALPCFQPSHGLIGLSAAALGKAACVSSPAAFTNYKDLHRSLFSRFLPPRLWPISSFLLVGQESGAPILLQRWLLPTVADSRALTWHYVCDHLQYLSPPPSYSPSPGSPQLPSSTARPLHQLSRGTREATSRNRAWLVNGQRFEEWKSSRSSLMWLHGSGT